MSRTREEIQIKVLSILVGGDIGQNPSAEDADAINKYIDDVSEELHEDGTASIGDTDAIDDGLFLTFCKLVANAAADEFGGKSDERLAQMLRNRMRVLVRPTPGYASQDVDFF